MTGFVLATLNAVNVRRSYAKSASTLANREIRDVVRCDGDDVIFQIKMLLCSAQCRDCVLTYKDVRASRSIVKADTEPGWRSLTSRLRSGT